MLCSIWIINCFKNSNKTISVINSNRKESPNGTLDTTHGIAIHKDVAKFNFHLDTAPVDGTYWILAVGPKFRNKYKWAIVSDSTGLFLFILARDIKRFNKMYEKDILELSNSLGFTGILKPIKNYQDSACMF
jgi:lipocalin